MNGCVYVWIAYFIGMRLSVVVFLDMLWLFFNFLFSNSPSWALFMIYVNVIYWILIKVLCRCLLAAARHRNRGLNTTVLDRFNRTSLLLGIGFDRFWVDLLFDGDFVARFCMRIIMAYYEVTSWAFLWTS